LVGFPSLSGFLALSTPVLPTPCAPIGKSVGRPVKRMPKACAQSGAYSCAGVIEKHGRQKDRFRPGGIERRLGQACPLLGGRLPPEIPPEPARSANTLADRAPKKGMVWPARLSARIAGEEDHLRLRTVP